MHQAITLPGLLDFDELLASLADNGDPLGAMAALELLQDLSRRVDVAAAGLLGSTAVPRLLAMTRSGNAMLRAQALQACLPPLRDSQDLWIWRSGRNSQEGKVSVRAVLGQHKACVRPG